jgi:tetratricopeptide (TPR) repeat protein
MPAHIYQRTGNYVAAAKANVAGADADRAFIKKYGGENMYSLMYYNHNLDFGATSYAMVGQYQEARALADEVSASAAEIAKTLPPIEPFTIDATKVLLRFNKWLDILRVPAETSGPYSAAFRQFARGIAFARLGNIEGAKSELRTLEAARASLSGENGFLQNSPKALIAVAAPLLEGQIAEGSGDRTAAIAAYSRAVEAEDALGYNEPADWYYPVRETLGAALLRNGEFVDAEQVFRADLDRNPNNPRSLFGLAAALRGQGRAAGGVTESFKKAWKGGALRIEDF